MDAGHEPGQEHGAHDHSSEGGAARPTGSAAASTGPNVAQLDSLWSGIVENLPPNQRIWLTSSRPLMLAENTAVVAVPNEFTRTQLEGRLRTRIEDSLSDRLGKPVRLAVSVDPALEEEQEALQQETQQKESLQKERGKQDLGQQSWAEQGGEDQSGSRISHVPNQGGSQDSYFPTHRHNDMSTRRRDVGSTSESLTTGIPDSPLNPRYSFETFVIGSSNRFAHAAAVAVAEAPGKAYNPLLVYGDSGLGKTHLLHAIGHYVRNLWTGARIRYVSSEAFTNDVINAIKDANTAALQRRYRDVDVLLVDDIQFLEGKAAASQEEFFHTFNTLHNANKQIVVSPRTARPSSWRPSSRTGSATRFEWGLITDVQPPELETRIAILRKKAADGQPLSVPAEVLELIASKHRDATSVSSRAR